MKFLVYGTLKQAFGNHRILFEGKAEFLGRAITLGNFVLVGHGVPFVWPHDEGYPLIGELYDIGGGDPIGEAAEEAMPMNAYQTLMRLDRLESNGRMYNRVRHNVRTLDDNTVHEGVWIYETFNRFGSAPHPNESDVVAHLTPEGRLEWEAERSKKPLAWGKPQERYYNEDAE